MSALATNSDKPRPIGDRRGTCCSAGGRRRSQDDTQTTSATRLETAAGPAAVPVGGGSGGVWVFRTVCFERVVLSSPGCLWPGRMDDHEEVLEAHA